MFTRKIIGLFSGLLATAVLGGSSIATQTFASFAPQQITAQQDEQRHLKDGQHDNPLADYLSKEEVAATTASVLGLSVEELQAAREAGTTLPELAEAAGVTIDDLKDAVTLLFNDAVNEALSDGAITQEQADKMLEHGPRFGKGGRGGGHGEGNNPLADYLSKEEVAATTASVLGLSVEELQAAREAGTTLPELAEAAGVTIDDLKDAVTLLFNDAVNEALADGAITQEQADKMLEHGPRFGKGKGGHGGNHGKGTSDGARPNRTQPNQINPNNQSNG